MDQLLIDELVDAWERTGRAIKAIQDVVDARATRRRLGKPSKRSMILQVLRDFRPGQFVTGAEIVARLVANKRIDEPTKNVRAAYWVELKWLREEGLVECRAPSGKTPTRYRLPATAKAPSEWEGATTGPKPRWSSEAKKRRCACGKKAVEKLAGKFLCYDCFIGEDDNTATAAALTSTGGSNLSRAGEG